MNAFVEATPISGPACVYAPLSVSRAILDPTTLQTPKTCAPASFAVFIAASVSAVSPLWEIAMTTSSGRIMGFRYLNSDAYSTSTGIRVNSSSKYSATKPACQLVPQPKMRIREAFCHLSQWSSIPAILISPNFRFMRPLIESRIDRGCSKISFSIKCSYPAFSMASSSISNAWTSGAIATLEMVRIRRPSFKSSAATSSSSKYTTFFV